MHSGTLDCFRLLPTEILEAIGIKIDRNKAILKTNQDGFMQNEIAKFLELTEASVSKILKKLIIKL